ncbi:MAG: methyltransferase domain-containing protein [Candidatus Dormibacteria bacterium]
MADWIEWHRGYVDPRTPQARRLPLVRAGIAEALSERAGRDELRILSLCAGDGRDLLPELARHPEPLGRAVLVELDPNLAKAARRRASSLGLARVAVVVGDAGSGDLLRPHLPVDLLLLCGIFGNLAVADLRRTIEVVPGMLRRGGWVIWTRGNRDPDIRESIRRWFQAAGLVEHSFQGAPEAYGVGVNRLLGEATSLLRLPRRLFRFGPGPAPARPNSG